MVSENLISQQGHFPLYIGSERCDISLGKQTLFCMLESLTYLISYDCDGKECKDEVCTWVWFLLTNRFWEDRGSKSDEKALAEVDFSLKAWLDFRDEVVSCLFSGDEGLLFDKE